MLGFPLRVIIEFGFRVDGIDGLLLLSSVG
jgi:hypothetical protein